MQIQNWTSDSSLFFSQCNGDKNWDANEKIVADFDLAIWHKDAITWFTLINHNHDLNKNNPNHRISARCLYVTEDSRVLPFLVMAISLIKSYFGKKKNHWNETISQCILTILSNLDLNYQMRSANMPNSHTDPEYVIRYSVDIGMKNVYRREKLLVTPT